MGGEVGLGEGLEDGDKLLLREGRGDGPDKGGTSTLGEEVGDPEGNLLGDTVGGEVGLGEGLEDGPDEGGTSTVGEEVGDPEGNLLGDIVGKKVGPGEDGDEEGKSQSHSPIQMCTNALSWPGLIHLTSTEADLLSAKNF